MAGDWLKVDVTLPDKPEVWQIAGITGIDPDAVVGKLLKVWRWFDAHTESGKAEGVAKEMIDALVSFAGFADAMIKARWLFVVGDGVELPNFDSHNGKTAKARAETARRVAKHRNKPDDSAKGNGEVTRETLPRPVVRKIIERDNNTCVYCGRRAGEYAPPEVKRDGVMCIDHVVPVSQGGTNDPINLVCACSPCNLFKSNRTPDECGLEWPTDENGNKFGVTSALPREEKRREEEKEHTSSGKKPPADPPCPHEQIIAAYHEILPTLPRVRQWTDSRKRHLQARWREDRERQDLDWWIGFFEYVRDSDFLMGRAKRGDGHEGFTCTLPWLLKAENFAKVLEGNYENREAV